MSPGSVTVSSSMLTGSLEDLHRQRQQLGTTPPRFKEPYAYVPSGLHRRPKTIETG